MTPFGIYLSAQFKDDINCQYEFTSLEKVFALYLGKKDQQKYFSKCNKKTETLAINKHNKYYNNALNENLRLIRIFTKVTTEFESISKVYKQLQFLKSNKSLFSQLLQSFIYLRAGNHTKSRYLLRKILEKDFIHHLFLEPTAFLFPREKQGAMFIYLLKKLNEEYLEKKILNTLISYVYLSSTEEFRLLIEDEFDTPSSLNSIQKSAQSIRFGRDLPFVWGPALFDLTSNKEYVHYLSKTKVQAELLSNKIGNYIFYRDINMISQKEKMIQKFMDLTRNKSDYYQYVFYELVDNETFYKFIMANSKVKLGLVSSKKRNYYKNLISKKILMDFSILNLLDLGDIDFQYIKKTLEFNE